MESSIPLHLHMIGKEISS